jgi:hypothetical protein
VVADGRREGRVILLRRPEFELEQRLAPLLFADDAPLAPANPVAPARRSQTREGEGGSKRTHVEDLAVPGELQEDSANSKGLKLPQQLSVRGQSMPLPLPLRFLPDGPAPRRSFSASQSSKGGDDRAMVAVVAALDRIERHAALQPARQSWGGEQVIVLVGTPG